MNDFTLCCNIAKCKVPLNETAWVTRCLHVFCHGHGQAHFSNSSPQIPCPICSEINLKEVDILHCEINPSDMVLAGLKPEKAILMAAKSLKLWWTQMQEEYSSYLTKINQLTKKNMELKYGYNKTLNKIKQKYESDINGLNLKKNSLIMKLEEVTLELKKSKEMIQKYKDFREEKLSFSHSFQNEENLRRSPNFVFRNNGFPDSPFGANF